MEEFRISQEELSKRLGKDRTTITNTLRLLKLPPEVRSAPGEPDLFRTRQSHSEPRSKEKQKELCSLIIKKGLSVREAEAIAKRWAEKPVKPAPPVKKRGDLESH